MRTLHDAALPSSAGRKAQMLARLGRAGAPVLEGLVLLPDESFDDDARAQIGGLGPGPYAVRSSSPLEDGVLCSAAGLYESITDVRQGELSAAVEAVRASAGSDAVKAYFEARGMRPAPIAVLIQAMAGRRLLGVANSDEDGWVIEEREAHVPEWGDSVASHLARDAEQPVARLLLGVESALAMPVQVEYARTDDDVVLLQARPIAAPSHRRSRAQVAVPSSIAWPAGSWRLDAEHNPDPISVAQAGLVALLESDRPIPRSCVLGCYLYVRDDLPARPNRDVDPSAALRRFFQALEPALLAEVAAADAAPLSRALATYRDVLRRYAAEVRPALDVERARFEAFLSERLHDRRFDLDVFVGGAGGTTTERDRALYELGRAPTAAALADYLASFGAYAPAWDVASPCDDEHPARVLATARRRAQGPDPGRSARAAAAAAEQAAAAVRERLPVVARAEFEHRWSALRAVHALGESDDRLFFAAQRLVRRALLRRGEELTARGLLLSATDVFDVALAHALEPTGDLRQQAAEARAAHQHARAELPPLRVIGGVPMARKLDEQLVLRGRPAGGRARGRAVVLRSLGQDLDHLPDGAVLVIPAALPSLAPHLGGLVGLVTEHGGALSHAATLARESGVAAVVGVAGALQIPDGADVYVDGVRGRVLLLDASPRTETT